MLYPPPEEWTSLRRVVVTGAGIVTALGIGWQANAAGFRLGQTAFRRVTLFDVSRHRVQQAAEVDLPPALPATALSAKRERRLDRAARMLLIAAYEAWTQAGWPSATDLPVVLGTTGGGMSLGEEYYRAAVTLPARRRCQPRRVVHYQSQQQGIDLLDAFGCEGPVTIIATACASGANAIGRAWELVRHGRASHVLAGGYDGLTQLTFSGFDSLQALSTTRCRPFDTSRDGLALGEGAAVVCLESLERARARGVTVLGEIIGFGASTDIHHLTQPHPLGDAALAAMKAATAAAGIAPSQVGYLNAHGTGTPLNDSAEANAINRWAGRHAPHLPVSSTKASVGHLLGAAGAVEAVVCLMAIREQWLPPQTVTEAADPICDFPLVRQPTDAPLAVALSNSFGFGGANASLVFRRWP